MNKGRHPCQPREVPAVRVEAQVVSQAFIHQDLAGPQGGDHGFRGSLSSSPRRSGPTLLSALLILDGSVLEDPTQPHCGRGCHGPIHLPTHHLLPDEEIVPLPYGSV